MQIVIDIQDGIKDMCDNAKPEKAMQGIEWFNGTLYKAIKEGIVLPKGHGRLIDADRLLTIQMRSKYYHLNNGDTAIPIIDVEHAHTVVPADKDGD